MASIDDPAVEPELDGFSLVLPLPYRVALITVLGTWAWGANLHYLHYLKIDVPALIRYPARPSPTHPPHHLSTYRLGLTLTLPVTCSLLLFWALTQFQASRVISFSFLPNLTLLAVPILIALPTRRLSSSSGRARFLRTLQRISIGGIATAQDGKFGDILLADALTSYAKVLGDLFVALCMIVTRRGSTSRPERSCGGVLMVPLLIAAPSAIRLRQCLIEYGRVRDGVRTGELDYRVVGWGGTHLANAAKYASAFPVVFLSALMRSEPGRFGMSETFLFRLWMAAVILNSLYSFYWDVSKDWDLTMFPALYRSLQRRLGGTSGYMSHLALRTPSPSGHPSYPYGLRPRRALHNPEIYYAVIVLDFILRMTWSFKLSPHLDHFNDLEGGIFLMEALEVFRRWVWIFLRVETEWVRGLPASSRAGLLGVDADGVEWDELGELERAADRERERQRTTGDTRHGVNGHGGLKIDED